MRYDVKVSIVRKDGSIESLEQPNLDFNGVVESLQGIEIAQTLYTVLEAGTPNFTYVVTPHKEDII